MWRRKKGLFVFHIGLIGLSFAGLTSALFNYWGTFALTEYQSAGSEFQTYNKGPLHKSKLEGFQFEPKYESWL